MRVQPSFQGYQDFVEFRTRRAVGQGGQSVPVLQLNHDSWERSPEREQAGKGTKLGFSKDRSSAYFRERSQSEGSLLSVPERVLHLHDVGAKVLANDILGWNLMPETELAELAACKLEPFTGDDGGAEKYLGSIQDWMDGKPLYDVKGRAKAEMIQQNRERIYQSWAYMVLAYDPDRAERNFVVRNADNSLWMIDANLTGANPQEIALLEFPSALLDAIAHTELPESVQNDLRRFVEHEEEYTAALSPYFEPSRIRPMFRRARFLLENPKVRNKYQLRERLLNL